MRTPQLEVLESRWLLSAGVLAAGQAQLFDFDGNGTDDGVLVNTGPSAIEYAYTAGEGLDRVDITDDGGSFVTNTWIAQIGDTSATDDFLLERAKVSVRIRYQGEWFDPIAGATSAQAGSIGLLKVGVGDLLAATATEGDIDRIRLAGGNLADVFAQAAVGTVLVDGDVVGSIFAQGGIGRVVADRIDGGSLISANGDIGTVAADEITNYAYIEAANIGLVAAGVIDGGTYISAREDIGEITAGTIETADIISGGDLDLLAAETLSGSGVGTTLIVGRHLGRLRADTITGGVNGLLTISINAGIDQLIAGLLEGGQAVGGGFASTDISVAGGIACFRAGLISGGISDGPGSFTMLNISVTDLYDDLGGVVSAGDVTKLYAAAISGGESINGGDAMLNFSISNDLAYARVGQIVGSGTTGPIADPSVYLTVGHDIVKLIAGEISAGTAEGDYAYASVWITAGNDIRKLTAGQINGGSAEGENSLTEVWITAGHDIGLIGANRFHGGSASGAGAMAAVYVNADRNIDVICAGRISGSQGVVSVDPTVQFIAGGDIGLVLAGRITGGSVQGAGALASVLLEANGTYAGTIGNIGRICVGTIDGGGADGAGATSYVKIRAANDITALYADRISGGSATNGGYSYVSILAENDIVDFYATTVIGSQTSDGDATSTSAVQIQAYNTIQSFFAERIIAGDDGTVNILAGQYDDSGELVGGTIEEMVVHRVSGRGGILNIAAGGDIESLKACRIVSGDGEVNIVAGGDITVDVRRVRSWSVGGETGVEFSAGGQVNDLRSSIRDEYVSEGGPVEFPAPIQEV